MKHRAAPGSTAAPANPPRARTPPDPNAASAAHHRPRLTRTRTQRPLLQTPATPPTKHPKQTTPLPRSLTPARAHLDCAAVTFPPTAAQPNSATQTRQAAVDY